MSFGAGDNPSVSAISVQQVTRPGWWLLLLFARPDVTFPVAQHQRQGK